MFTATVKSIAFTAALLCAYAAHADRDKDRTAVKVACAKEADKIGCAEMKLSHGLGRCIIGNWKTHPKFKPNPACKAALLKLIEDKAQIEAVRNGMKPHSK